MNSPGGLNVGGVYFDVELNTAKMLRDSRQADSALRGVEFRMGAVALAVKGLVAALALLQMARVADEARLLAARVEVAAGSLERGAEAMNALARISARTQTELAANVQVFTRLNSSILQMGGTQQDTLRITDLLAMAIKVSGASAAEAGSAMTQFGQALGSGKLAGDELRSLLENAPYLMKQLAAGIGVPVGALKQLGEEGKLTADVVTAALTKAAAQIEADFGKLPKTFEAAMIALVDQLRRASLAADNLTGTSDALAGVATGAAEAVGLLADQLKAASGEADTLGRNSNVASWARSTTDVLTYVVDAADFVGRYFRIAGLMIGGAAAALTEFASGLSGAKRVGSIIAEMRADIEKISERPYAGQNMRARIAALGTADTSGYMDRSDRMALGTPSTLTPPPAAPGKPKKGGKAAVADKAATDEVLEGIKQQIEAEAKLARLESDRIRMADERAAKDAAAEEQAQRKRDQGAQFAAGLAIGNDPIARLQFELEQKSALLKKFAADDMKNEELYKAAKVQLEQDTALRITEILADQESRRQALQSQTVNAYGALFGSLADLSRQFAGEQSGIFKAMFVAQKAFSIASAIINIQKGISDALAQGATLPQKLAGAALVASSAAGIVSTIQGVQYGGGRQYGGPVSAGSMYRVNETGAPEMFVGSGGRQYMLPNTSGQVVPADEVGGMGGGVQVVVNNYTGERVDVQQSSDGRMIEIAVGRAVGEVASQIRENSGPVFSALTGSTNVRPRM